MKAWFWIAVFMLINFAVMAWGVYEAPDSSADANSYLGYLADHHINTAINTPSKNLSAGFYICSAMHAGQTADDIVAGQRIAIVDIRGMVDAAQRELCPDTLH